MRLSLQTIFGATCLLMLVACGGNRDEPEIADTTPVSETETTDTRPAPSAAATSLHMVRLDCGELDVVDMASYDRNGSLDGQEGALAVSCWLIRHPEGDLIFELGLPTALAGLPGMDSPPYSMYLSKTISQQLTSLGLFANDIEYVAFSGNHFEHIGQADQFAGATWLTTTEEKEDMFPEAAADPDIATAISEAPALGDMTTTLFSGELDVFGDGSVKLIEMPGPTMGHKILFADLPSRGPVLISGDIFHSPASREDRLVPVFFSDEAATLSSMDAISELLDSTGAELIIPYDFDLLETLPDKLE